MRRYPYAHTAVIATIMACLAAPAIGEPTRTGMFGRHRLIKHFDFEEAEQNNFEDLPRHWYVIGRPADTADPNFLQHPVHAELINATGFPGYTQVRFDKPQHESGDHHLFLGLNGGNAGAFVEVGTLPAVPTSDYLVTAAIRTKDLTQAGVRLSAYFIDSTGNRIKQSTTTSPLIRTEGEWKPIAVKLYGEHPDAAWIGLQIELRQPTYDPRSPLGERQVVQHQVAGSAWIDDVSVWQMPRVKITSQSPVNIIRAPATPRLTMQVRDLTGRALRCDVTLFDTQLQPMAHHSKGLGEGAPIKWLWDPQLERFGWYLIQMSVSEPTGAGQPPALIAQTLSAILWLPEEPPLVPGDANRFTITAEGLPEAYMQLLPDLLDKLDLRSTVLSIWDRSTQRAGLPARLEHLDTLIQAILNRGWKVGLSLNPLPTELATELDLDASNPLEALSKRQTTWLPYLSPALIRHGQRVHHWHLGPPAKAEAIYIDNLAQLMASTNEDFRNVAPDPHLIIPWKLSQPRLGDDFGGSTIALHVPLAVRPEAIKDHLADWRHPPTPDIDLHLQLPSATDISHEQRVRDLLTRMIHAWEANPNTLVIDHPWTRAAGRQTALLPDPLLGVFSQTAHRLAGRRVAGRLDTGHGLECIILRGSRGGMLAAWNRSADPEDAVIDMYLGEDPVIIDAWGNRRRIALVDGRHRVQLGETPIFIENIDADLALFRASFKLEPRFIESTLSPHRRLLKLTNPWNRTISGNFLIDNPPTWHVSPKRHYFSIASGETATLPVDLQFPIYEVAGDKVIAARFDFIATNRYLVDISTSMELGLENVHVDATLTIEQNPETGALDAVITQLISNTGDSGNIALYAFASLSGHARQERIVAQLKPGQTIVRRFRFEDGAKQIRTTPVRVGVRQTTGPAVLNKILSIDDH